MRLAPAWEGLEVAYLTTDPDAAGPLAAAAAAAGRPPPRVIAVPEANRWHRLRLLRQMAQIVWAVARLRPDVVITTGAAPGYFALRAGKLAGARTVWIDSLANTEAMSLSGARARRHADLWLTQWPHLAAPGGPAFLGSVL
jgi:UDP-N-acetylglucosamine:LPS N-acetylglucosamine transferase